MPLPRGKENYMANVSATPPKRREAPVASEEKGRAPSYSAAAHAFQPEILQSPPQKSGSMFGQKSFPIKHTFIHYDSPRKTLTISSPPKSVPPNFAPTVVMRRQMPPNFSTKGPLPQPSPAPMQTLRLSDYLSSPVGSTAQPMAVGAQGPGPVGAQGSMSCGVVGMPDFACGQMAQGGMSGFPPVPPLPGQGQMIGPGVDGNGNGQQTLMMGPCMEGTNCQQMPMGNLDSSQPNCHNVVMTQVDGSQPNCQTVVMAQMDGGSQQNCQPVMMAQGIDTNGQAIMMGPINDGSGNFVIGQMVELAPAQQMAPWGDCTGGNMGNSSMFSQCLFQNNGNGQCVINGGMQGQCGIIVEEPSAMSMPCTPCNGGQITPQMNGMQVPNGGNAMNAFGMNNASAGNAMPGQSSSPSKSFLRTRGLGRC